MGARLRQCWLWVLRTPTRLMEEAIFVEGAPIAVRYHVTSTFTRSAATQGKYGVVLSVGVVLLRVKENCIRDRSIHTSRQLVRARARMCPRAQDAAPSPAVP